MGMIMSAGTGGTVTGTALKLKEKIPAYHVEGIGYDFVPTVLDQDVVDYWVKTDDDESFAMGRNVVRHEGLLIGGSCGATMAGAYKFIKENNIGAGKRVGVLFADSSRNYMSKFMDDDWMATNGFNMGDISKSTKEKGFFAKLFGF